MDRFFVRFLAALIVFLALSGCAVRCEATPMFADTFASWFASDRPAKKGR